MVMFPYLLQLPLRTHQVFTSEEKYLQSRYISSQLRRKGCLDVGEGIVAGALVAVLGLGPVDDFPDAVYVRLLAVLILAVLSSALSSIAPKSARW
jgi:hypothetical protein